MYAMQFSLTSIMKSNFAYGCFAFLASFSLHAEEQIQALYQDSRQTLIRKNLVVNTDNNYRILAYKSKEEGERDLHAASHNSKVEESYIFVPSIPAWIEVGEQETDKSVRCPPTFVTEVIKQFPNAIMYHIHVNNENYFEYMPSFLDALSTAALYGAIKEHNLSWTAVERIVSSKGISQLSYTEQKDFDKIIQNYNSMFPGYGPRYSYWLVKNMFIPKYRRKMTDCLSKHENESIYHQLEKCGNLSMKTFSVQFLSYQKN